MKFRVATVSRVKESFVLEGEQEYLKRMKPYAKVDLVELGGEKHSSLPESSQKEKHANLLLSQLQPGEQLIVLDETGKQFDSRSLAQHFEQQGLHGSSQFLFGIGGAYGWNQQIRNKAQLVLSLSPLTFPYQLTRLILIEQLYRSITLLKGVPYHK